VKEQKPNRRKGSKESSISNMSKNSQASAGSKESQTSERLSRYGLPIEQTSISASSDKAEYSESRWEHFVQTSTSISFMLLVGLSMPPLVGKNSSDDTAGMTPSMIIVHVFAVSVLMILGKMFPSFCYRDEVGVKERFALCLGMCPRGEVGASIIVISLELKIGGPALIISMIALALNLVMSGGFVASVKCLLRDSSPVLNGSAITPCDSDVGDTLTHKIPDVGVTCQTLGAKARKSVEHKLTPMSKNIRN